MAPNRYGQVLSWGEKRGQWVGVAEGGTYSFRLHGLHVSQPGALGRGSGWRDPEKALASGGGLSCDCADRCREGLLSCHRPLVLFLSHCSFPTGRALSPSYLYFFCTGSLLCLGCCLPQGLHRLLQKAPRPSCCIRAAPGSLDPGLPKWPPRPLSLPSGSTILVGKDFVYPPL